MPQLSSSQRDGSRRVAMRRPNRPQGLMVPRCRILYGPDLGTGLTGGRPDAATVHLRQHLVRRRGLDGTRPSGEPHLDPARDLRGTHRDRLWDHRGELSWSANDDLDRLPRDVRVRSADVPRGRRDRARGAAATSPTDARDRDDLVPSSVPRCLAVRRARERLGPSGRPHRRDRVVDDVRRGRLRGDGRDRPQRHRSGEDDPCRVLRDRLRYRPRARRAVRELQRVHDPIHRDPRDEPLLCRG